MGRILIIGGSGFLGQALYRELQPYFDVYATYCNQVGPYKDNQVFRQFNAEKHSVLKVLEELKPTVVISAFSSSAEALVRTHAEMVDYVGATPDRRLILLSSYEVFDARWKYPSYEQDSPMSESYSGKLKLTIEKQVRELLPDQWAILRLPWVLGVNSPTIYNLRQAGRNQTSFEIFPKMVISVTTDDKLAQQVHYVINQDLHGVFHLASSDLVHHEDLFTEISEKINPVQPVFKRVFQSNDDRYYAILPAEDSLPDSYSITVADVIGHCTLQEEISSLKTG
ncbi:sugar nucleotide-binding protein [Aureitalea marina]|uniref:dTDP-4-dehydrorhamnose reductase n=1 Tax=Aureitalea marina TaxID=930804 RepID=A0A2S7KNX1_9FLAO|nr:sugar nucleotide-binding protein [Aureitalea marina]PQB04315.1 hypothetical protein BST85_04945 [Aureitalea marina]